MSTKLSVVPTEAEGEEKPKKKFSTSAAWTPTLAKTRHVAVVHGFLDHYSSLRPPLTSGEAMFVIHLMRFKWGEEAPFPGYKTIAKLMGISTKMARRHAQSLEQKGYLDRQMRLAQTNKFDLTKLFRALEMKISAIQKKKHSAAADAA